jgi:hypothetical protein
VVAEKKRFSDFAKRHTPLAGDKMKMADVLDKEIEVLSYRVSSSRYNGPAQCLQLQFKLADALCVLFTGSQVLIEQCETYKNEIPFIATIRKIDRFYSFT